MSKRSFSGHQPNFMPYMGFFKKMSLVDVFVLDDDVKFSRSGYQNYNYLKVNGRRFKVTVPVSYSDGDPINKVKISYASNWRRKLLGTLVSNYKRAAYFDIGYQVIERALSSSPEFLVDLNVSIIRAIAEGFGIRTELLISSRDLQNCLTGNARNIKQCLDLGADVYLSGDGGAAYNDEGAWRANGIDIEYLNYEPVKYKQIGEGFLPNLSALDYIMNEGFSLPGDWIPQYA